MKLLSALAGGLVLAALLVGAATATGRASEAGFGTVTVRGSESGGDGEEAPTSVSLELRYRLTKGVRSGGGATFTGTMTYRLRVVWRQESESDVPGVPCVREKTIDATGTRAIPRQADGRVRVHPNRSDVRLPSFRSFRVPMTIAYSAVCGVDERVERGSYRVSLPAVDFSGRVRGRRLTYSGPIPGRAGGTPLQWSYDADASVISSPRVSAVLTLP